MGWMARVLFPLHEKFALLHSVKTGSGAYPTSYPMSPGTRPTGRLDNHSLSSSVGARMVELNLHTTKRLYGVVLNYAQAEL
jgi:hypothetical protein